MSNKKLKILLSDLEKKAKESKTNEELLAAVQLAVDYKRPLKFNMKIPIKIIATCDILLVSLLLFLCFGTNDLVIEEILIISSSALIISILSLMFYCSQKEKIIGRLSSYINNKDILQDNKIKRVKLTDSGFEGYETITKDFQEFKRGNFSRKIKEAFLIKKESLITDKSFHSYKFNYVDKKTVIVPTTSVDSNGNVKTGVRTETKYYYYNRSGIIYDFGLVKNINVFSNKTPDNDVDYNSSSIDFSSKFDIGASNEMEAAKFLKPKVVETILKMEKIVDDINIEIDEKGIMCLSFDEIELIKLKENVTLHDPEAFYNELSGHTKLNKLEAILSCIVELEKQLDDNFKEEK